MRFKAIHIPAIVLLILAYIALSITVLVHHEHAHEEGQAWLIARDSKSIGAIIRQAAYEGSPALWHLILFPMARWGAPISGMAALNFLIILTALIILAFRAPFSKLQKGLILFGYYPFFEYGIIARSYSLSILLLFLIACMYKKRFARPIIFSGLLFLLANTNTHSLVIAIVLAAAYMLEMHLRGMCRFRARLASAFIILAGCAAAFYQIAPPSDLAPQLKAWYWGWNRLTHVWYALANAFIPIPALTVNFWNIPLADKIVNPCWLGPLLFLFSLLFFIRTRTAFFIYLVASLSLIALFFLKVISFHRHHGFIFILFIFTLWIAGGDEGSPLRGDGPAPCSPGRKSLSAALTALLALHVFAAGIASYYDYRYDFSAGYRAAVFLIRNGYVGEDTFIAVYPPSDIALTILPYMPGPHTMFFYCECDRYQSFLTWTKELFSQRQIPPGEMLHRIDGAIRGKNYRTVLLIIDNWTLTRGVRTVPSFASGYERIACFPDTETVIDYESLSIYRRH